MRIKILTAVMAALMLAGCATPTAPSERGWRPLFDGKSLAGWTPKIRGFALGENYRDTFTVKDGVLRVSYAKYDRFDERFGHLFYAKPFKAYRLRVEYRFTD